MTALCTHPMTVASLFDGIGGGPEAFRRAGAVTVATCEIDKAAAGVAADHFPEAKAFTDIRELTADDLLAAGFCPVCGTVIAGFPCQDLSLAGRRAGLDGARSGLFFEIVRIARDLRPRWLVLENVPGLLSSVCPCPGWDACGRGCGPAHPVRGGACGPGRCIEVHGGAMGAVLGSLAELGYGFAYRVLDAQHFGVPQRRRRVFIVGCLGDGRAPAEVLLEPEGGERDPRTGRTTGPSTARRAADVPACARREVVGAIGLSGIGGNGGPDDNAAQAGHVVAVTLTRSGAQSLDPEMEQSIGFDLAQITSAANRSNPQPGDPQPTLAAGGQAVVAVGGAVTHALTSEGADASEDGAGRGTPGNAFGHKQGLDPQASEENVPTLRANGDGAAVMTPDPDAYRPDAEQWPAGGVDPYSGNLTATAVRRLTPVECERLQGYPDGWTALSHGRPQADSARYRQLGNSYALPVVEWIARRIVGWTA